MAYDSILGNRISEWFNRKKVPFEEKKMMGGLCFMVDDKMCVGVMKDELMARIDPEVYEDALREEACHEMDFTGRVLKGFILVEPEGIAGEKDLDHWMQMALDFNPKAKSSKKKKKA
ncbi:MAG: TfoX/Sxy family protein [Owenweeksia sp.]